MSKTKSETRPIKTKTYLTVFQDSINTRTKHLLIRQGSKIYIDLLGQCIMELGGELFDRAEKPSDLARPHPPFSYTTPRGIVDSTISAKMILWAKLPPKEQVKRANQLLEEYYIEILLEPSGIKF